MEKKEQNWKENFPAKKQCYLYAINQPCYKLIFISNSALDLKNKKAEVNAGTTEYKPQLYKAKMVIAKSAQLKKSQSSYK